MNGAWQLLSSGFISWFRAMKQSTAVRIIYFLVFCCTGAWLPKLYDYCLDRGFSSQQSALILSIPPVMMFAVQPAYGFLADKLGHKKTLLLSSLAAAFSYLGFLIAQDFLAVVIVTFFMALFYNTLQPVMDSMALHVAAANPAFSYGTLRIYGAVGFSVGSIVTGQIIDAIDLTVIFIVSAVTMFISFVICFFLKDQKQTEQAGSNYAGVTSLIRSRSLQFLLLTVFLVSVGATAIWNFYSAYMKENGATDSLVGFGLSFQGLCELPLFYFSARIIARLGLRTSMLITILATVIRLALYYVIKIPVATLPVELLQGFSWSLYWVVCVEYVNKLVDEKWLATGQSLLYAAYFGAGAIAGNYWATYFIEKGMHVSKVYLINAGVVAIPFLLWMFFGKRTRSSH